jgi:hypothetical protein
MSLFDKVSRDASDGRGAGLGLAGHSRLRENLL